ncbi:hypothetical protein [Candidatus Bandiella numerosa]|uniref:hypothetical protein n=1 Tax=Candidatus Bandiella numerosa TaxID=2570586 RepID=UPI001F200A2F|nr:hypothetical protein [Candidatus Bandiella numerosa]
MLCIYATALFFGIAKEIKPCIDAFKAQNYTNNATKVIDLAVTISTKLEADYALKGNAVEYLKSFVKDAVQAFSSVSADVEGHDYIKALVDFVDRGTTLAKDQESLVTAIMQDVSDAQSSSNTAVKQFQTDKTAAAIDLFENVISAVCSTVEVTEQPKEEL